MKKHRNRRAGDSSSNGSLSHHLEEFQRCLQGQRYAAATLAEYRRCLTAFVGTVNHGTYLRDETGARRFWPVACVASMSKAWCATATSYGRRPRPGSMPGVFGGWRQAVWFNWPRINRGIAMKATHGKKSLRRG